MAPTLRDKTGTVFASACCATALLNTVFTSTGYAQRNIIPVEPDPPPSEENILRYGDFDVRPSLRIGAMYDDNIFIENSGEEDDFLWVFTPGVHLGSGDYGMKEENYIVVNYEPDFVVFTHNSSHNEVDHDALFEIQRRPGNWTLNLQQAVATFSGQNSEIGGRVDETVYVTSLGAKYDVSPKTSAEVNLQQTIDDFDGRGLDGFNEWVAALWADYQALPKLRTGVGVTGGILDVQGSVNQDYIQPLVRLVYSLTGKLDLKASGGLDYRMFSGGKDDRVEPVFSLGGLYRPREGTVVNLDAYHEHRSSNRSLNANYRSTGVRGSIVQDFRTKYHLLIGAGYEFLNYYSTADGFPAPREDDYMYARIGLSWDALDQLNIGVFYQYKENDSNTTAVDFDSNQVGITATYRF